MRALSTLLLVMLCLAPPLGRAADAGLPPGAIQRGTLANPKLIQDAKVGIASKVAMLGCTRLGDVQIYVTAAPKGTPGNRRWQELWVVSGCSTSYPVHIEFWEDGPDAANWSIDK